MTEADVQQLLEQNPTDPVLKALFASLQRRSGKIREALVLLESGLASYEAFPERLYLLWKTYDEQLGNHQKGELFVRRLLEVDPLNDRATGLGYSNLDEETLRHINFVKSLEDLPDSIFAMVLPVGELENLIGTTEADALDITALTPCEQRTAAALERTFTPPGIPQQPQVPEPGAPPQVSPAVTSLTSEEPAVPPQPIMAHMASMLEQAQLIARDLRPTPAMKPAPEQPRPPPPVEPDVDTVLQKEELAAESAPILVPEPHVESIAHQPAAPMPGAPVKASPVSSVPQPIPTTMREPVSVAESVAEITSSERPSQPAELAHVTMRYANSLLEDSRFEEALQAFLELSHTS
jgi:tetratricopeptide (TPR) repeat protein